MCFCCAIYISLNILQDLVSLVSCYSLTFSVRIRQSRPVHVLNFTCLSSFSKLFFFSCFSGAEFYIKVSMNGVAKVMGWQGVVRGESPGAVQRSPGLLCSFVSLIFKGTKQIERL